jgi:predicted phosphodiesterase
MSNKIYALIFLIILLVVIFFDQNSSIIKFSTILNKISLSLKPSINLCEIPRAKDLSGKFFVVSGHAYDSNREDHLFSTNLQKFIQENSKSILGVILTGDVLFRPEPEKWRKVKEFFKKLDVNIYIAPGNHDTGFDNTILRQNFNQEINANYPIIFENEGAIFIIDDSTIDPWKYQSKTIDIAKQISDSEKKLFLFSHHITIDELSSFANSSERKPKFLPSFINLSNQFKNNFKEIYFISGDTGAFNFLPNRLCINNQNSFFLIQGINDLNNDSILLIKNNSIAFTTLK